jgi:hypothetical protein
MGGSCFGGLVASLVGGIIMIVGGFLLRVSSSFGIDLKLFVERQYARNLPLPFGDLRQLCLEADGNGVAKGATGVCLACLPFTVSLPRLCSGRQDKTV